MVLCLLFAVVLSSTEGLTGVTHITHYRPISEASNLFDLFLSFQLHQKTGTHGESGASAQHHVVKVLDGGIEFALLLLLVEKMKIALVILLRLKFARQLIVKVHLLHITQLTQTHEGRLLISLLKSHFTICRFLAPMGRMEPVLSNMRARISMEESCLLRS